MLLPLGDEGAITIARNERIFTGILNENDSHFDVTDQLTKDILMTDCPIKKPKWMGLFYPRFIYKVLAYITNSESILLDLPFV